MNTKTTETEEVKVPYVLIQSEDKTSLVEAKVDGQMVRVFIPTHKLTPDELPVSLLNAGIPYGVPFEEIFEAQASGEAVAKAMHDNGVWTVEDMRNRPEDAIAALQAAYRLDFAMLIKAAEEQKAKPKKVASTKKDETKKENEL